MPDGTVPAVLTAAAGKARALILALPTPRMQRFVEFYLQPVDGKFNASEAVRRAGYTGKSANRRANDLMRRKDIRAAVEAARADLQERAAYSTEVCMAELGEAMAFALRTENASAYVRAVELRGRLSGVLVDKLDARIAVGVFQIRVEGLGDA